MIRTLLRHAREHRLAAVILSILSIAVGAGLATVVTMGLRIDPATMNGAAAGGDGHEYAFDASNTDLTLAADGSLQVREHIGFDFVGTSHVAFRDIGLRDGERVTDVLVSDNTGPYRLHGDGNAGAPGSFGAHRTGNVQRVAWYFDAHGRHPFIPA